MYKKLFLKIDIPPKIKKKAVTGNEVEIRWDTECRCYNLSLISRLEQDIVLY